MISVIIHAPSGGAPGLLAETVRRSTHAIGGDWEWIVVGDVGDLPSQFRHGPFGERATWIDAAGIGRADAVNEAIGRTRGDILSMLTAGSFHFEETLRIVAEAAERHPHVDCFCGDAMLADASGRPFAEFNVAGRPGRGRRHHLRLCAASTFIRRIALDRSGPLDSSLRYWADYDLWLRLEQAGAVFRRIPRLLAARRTSASSPAESDFTSLPTVESLDELMRIRLRSSRGPIATSRLAWYGTMRVAIESKRTSSGGVAEAMRHAIAAHRRHCADRPIGPWQRLVLSGTIAHAMLRGRRFLKEFVVHPIGQPAVSRCQFLRRRIFRLAHHPPRPLSLPPSYALARPPAKPPTISIVTPSFNQGHVLEETLRSVLDQGYPALEYFVQDGGSSDESVGILERYGPRLTSWQSAPDGGQAAAINLGLRRSTGEIMAYLNSDDLLLPGSLAYVAAYFESHPEVDVVYGHRVLVDERGREIGRWVLPPHDDHAIAFADFIPQETMFWRRRAWEKVGSGIDESFRFAMDWDLILRFRESGLAFRRLPRFLGAFRVWTNQKSLAWWLPVGRHETERLTARTFGATPSRERVRREIGRYLGRHWMLDKLYLAGLVRY